MLAYKRSTRVAELLHQEISKIVLDIKDSGFGFVTITGVKLSDDLQDARIYYSVIGSEEQIRATSEILRANLPQIRHQIAVRVNLRRTPALTIEYDHTPENASKIFEILEKINNEGKVQEPLPQEAPDAARKVKRTTKKKNV